MKRKVATSKIQRHHQDELALHRTWLKRAEAVATQPVSRGGSPHPTTKVGAILVDQRGREIASSANRFAQGVDRRRPERFREGYKSLWINCAEQLAITDALKKRAQVKGASLYVSLEPCAICAGMIAELDIKMVCVPVGSFRRYAKLKAKWKKSIEVGLIKLTEAGVPLITVDME
jgi:tRNA(Arg) A34 adenosine deaminase TadA